MSAQVSPRGEIVFGPGPREVRAGYFVDLPDSPFRVHTPQLPLQRGPLVISGLAFSLGDDSSSVEMAKFAKATAPWRYELTRQARESDARRSLVLLRGRLVRLLRSQGPPATRRRTIERILRDCDPETAVGRAARQLTRRALYELALAERRTLPAADSPRLARGAGTGSSPPSVENR